MESEGRYLAIIERILNGLMVDAKSQLDDQTFNNLFSHIPSLYQIHSLFYSELQAHWDTYQHNAPFF